jgi:hypothetical protein
LTWFSAPPSYYIKIIVIMLLLESDTSAKQLHCFELLKL